jgi:hypothetical protein
MELFSKAVERLENSNEFKAWRKKHKKDYLSSGFVIVEKEQSPWKAGYYDKKKNKITSFVIGEKVEIEPEEEIFQKEKVEIKSIDLDSLNVDLPEAIVLAGNFQKDNYKGEEPVKIIAILQNIDSGQIWNIIFITQKFNTLNIKVDCHEGKIIGHNLTSMMNFIKKDEKSKA